MKSILICFRVVVAAAALTAVGCKDSSTAGEPKRPIPLAPVGVTSPGIGGPGGDSEDTRAVGSTATGEGDAPLESLSGAAPVTAAPGSVRAAQGRY